MHLRDLSDDELVSRLAAICLEGHKVTARLIVHLIEVEARRLDLRAACTSLMYFCVRRLGMSEGAAFRRINAARLVRRFPSLLARIEEGTLHLSTLVLLRPHLTEANVEELAAVASGKTQRQVEELLARLAPKPDVPSSIVELPRSFAQTELRPVTSWSSARSMSCSRGSNASDSARRRRNRRRRPSRDSRDP